MSFFAILVLRFRDLLILNSQTVRKHPAQRSYYVGIHDLVRLRKKYGPGNWRKLSGRATIRMEDGRIHTAEIHWYEAHGIGRKRFKTKQILD